MSRDVDFDERELRPESQSRMLLFQGRGGGSGSAEAKRKGFSETGLADLRERIDRAATGRPSLGEFFDRLEQLGVRPIPSVQSSGRWNGIVFERGGLRAKGSHLGRAYTAQGLQERRGIRYDPGRDLDRLRQTDCSTPSGEGERFDPREGPTPPRDRAWRERGADGISAAERALLWEAGRFRALSVADIEKAQYQGDARALRRDLKHLMAQGLLTRRTVVVNNRARTLTVVALTRRGKALLKRSATGDAERSQAIYTGFVKPREIEHDAAIYRMYLREAERIERAGGRVRRVVLDYELKKRAYSPLAKAHDLPALQYAERQQEIAAENGLEVVDGRLVLPDLRIEWETPDGEERHIDLELATRNYRSAHIRAKAAAGFKVYVDSNSGPLSAVLDDHDLVAELLRT